MSSSPFVDPAGWDETGGIALEVSELSAAEVVDALGSTGRTVDRAEADRLALVVHYVDLHPVTDTRPAACWDLDEGLGDPDSRRRVEVPLAGVGTPGVADHAVEALGPVLGMGYRATKAYVAGAVELAFRLPRLWALVQAGRLQAWRALRVAEATVTLSPDTVGFVDRHVAVIAGRNKIPGPGQLRALVHEALLQCDPDTAPGREEAALADRDVRFEHTTATGISAMTATLDTPDALDLQTTIDDLATAMGRLGDTDPLGVRRSRALGSLADPQRTLDLYGNPHPDPTLDRVPDTDSDSHSHGHHAHGNADGDADGEADGEDAANGDRGGPDANAVGDAACADCGDDWADSPGIHRSTVDREARARVKFGDPRCPGWNRSIGHLYAHVSVSDLIGRPGSATCAAGAQDPRPACAPWAPGWARASSSSVRSPPSSPRTG